MTEPVKCRCGKEAQEENIWYGNHHLGLAVKCSRDDCWEGPMRKTARKAINAWNKVMEVK